MIPTLNYLQFWLLCLPAFLLGAFAEGLDLRGAGLLLVGVLFLLPILGRVLPRLAPASARKLTALAGAGLLLTSVGCYRHLVTHGWDAKSAALAGWLAAAALCSWSLARAAEAVLRSRANRPAAGEIAGALVVLAVAWSLGRWEAPAVHAALAGIALAALASTVLGYRSAEVSAAEARREAAPGDAVPGNEAYGAVVRPLLGLLAAVDLFLVALDQHEIAAWGALVGGAFLVAALVQGLPKRLETLALLVFLAGYALGVLFPSLLLSPARCALSGIGLGLILRGWLPALGGDSALAARGWVRAWAVGLLFAGVLYQNLALVEVRAAFLLLVPWATIWRSGRSPAAPSPVTARSVPEAPSHPTG